MSQINSLSDITNNGLWIKDNIDGKINIINASKIDEEFLVEVSITELDKEFKVKRQIESDKRQISKRIVKIKNELKKISKSHVKVFVWKIFFNPELQILSSNFWCKNFSQLQFFVEIQMKRVPPQYEVVLGGGTRRKVEFHLTC